MTIHSAVRLVRDGVRVAVLAAVVFAIPVSGDAQTTAATISGTVKDSSGAVLPGVTVSATNVDTGTSRDTVSDAEGRYTLPNLSLGAYELRAELSGFRQAVRKGITLTVGRHAVVDLVLEVGAMTEEVVVTGEASLVDTTDAQVGGLVDERQIRELPLNARSFTDLALFQTGVRLSRVTGTGGITSGGFGTMMTISGARPESNVYKLDGTDISDVFQRSTGNVTRAALGVEAVREFEVLTHNYGADQGKFSGGVVNVVTRSGTNKLDGSLFAFHRNDALDARNFFDLGEKPDFSRNQFGGAFGGPILKDRTFVFANYEGLREELGRTTRVRVPTEAARRGLLQDSRTGEFVPVQIKPAVVPYLNLYPLPTPGGRDFQDGTAEFITTTRRPADQDYGVVRVDHHLGNAHSAFARYTYTRGSVYRTNPPHNLFQQHTFNRNHYITAEDRHILTPRLLATYRVGFTRNRIGEVNIPLDPIGEDPALLIVPGKFLPQLSPSGVSSIGAEDSIPEIFTKNLLDATYQLMYSARGHEIKVGAQVNREVLDVRFETRQNSRWSFPSLRDFLEGTNVSRLQIAPPQFADPFRTFHQWYAGFYVQDDWKLRNNLTLNLGLRTEFTTEMTEKDGKSSYLPESLLRTGSNRDLVIGEGWYDSPGLHWAPRVGFAWDPRATGRTSLRGGVGLYYDHIMPFWHTIGAWRMFPHYNVIGANRLPNGRPLPFPLKVDELLAIFGAESLQVWQFQQDPEKIRTLHFNVGWQQQLGSDFVVKLAYVGTRGSNLGTLAATNEAQPIGTTPDGNPLFGRPPHSRPNPNYEIIDIMATDAEADYNGMELEVSKRFSGGLKFQSSYTLAKMTDTKAGIRTGSGDVGGSVRRDFVDLTLRGLSEFDIRHNFSFNATYEVPSPSGGAMRAAFGGWQVSTLLTLATGHPFTVTQRAARGDLKNIYRPDVAEGRSLGDDVILGTPEQYFDPSAFVFSDPQRFGNAGRNTLTGPGLATLDLSLTKLLPLSGVAEDLKVQFRSEFFNILNRANFAQPAANVFDARGRPDRRAGQITSTTTTGRQIQFGLKVLW